MWDGPPLCICPQARAQVGLGPLKHVAAPCPTSNHAQEPRGHLPPARSSKAQGRGPGGRITKGTSAAMLGPLIPPPKGVSSARFLLAAQDGTPLGYHSRAHEGQHGVWTTSREAVLGVTGRTQMNQPNLGGMDEESKRETHPRLFRNQDCGSPGTLCHRGGVGPPSIVSTSSSQGLLTALGSQAPGDNHCPAVKRRKLKVRDVQKSAKVTK